MFTGIVESMGTVAAVDACGGGRRISIAAPELAAQLQLGQSIATAGACISVTATADGRFAADLSAETCRLTTLGTLRVGDGVNLERAMAASDRFDGHLVAGHIDGLGRLEAMDAADGTGARAFRFASPIALASLVAAKGSIAIDGVSLTVNEVGAVLGETFSFAVTLIPLTLEATTLGKLEVGDAVNLEADLIARYVARLAGFAGFEARGDR